MNKKFDFDAVLESSKKKFWPFFIETLQEEQKWTEG